MFNTIREKDIPVYKPLEKMRRDDDQDDLLDDSRDRDWIHYQLI